MRYAGIGSRETPQNILDIMSYIASCFAQARYTLLTGGASGADQAFMRGAETWDGEIELYLPWKGFEGYNAATRTAPDDDAYEIAEKYHPAFPYLKQGARKLIARNSYQVLGEDLQTPVDLVVCWTADASLDGTGPKCGGTGQALRIAADRGIEIKNLADPEHRGDMVSLAEKHELIDV